MKKVKLTAEDKKVIKQARKILKTYDNGPERRAARLTLYKFNLSS